MIRRHRTSLSLAIAVGMLLAFASVGLAARGGGSSTLDLVVLASGDARVAEPSHGGQVTFEVGTEVDRPFVNLRCYQDGAWVYDDWHGFFDSYYTDPIFTLSSAYWSGGGAECTARLVDWGRNGKERTLTSLTFDVSA